MRATFRGVEWETEFYIPVEVLDTPGDEVGAVGFGTYVALSTAEQEAERLTELNHEAGLPVIIEAVELEGEVYLRPQLVDAPATTFEPGTLVVFKGYHDDVDISDALVGEVGTVDGKAEDQLAEDETYYEVSFVGLENAPFGNYLLAPDEFELAPEGTVAGDVLAEVE